MQINVLEARNQLSKLIQAVLDGEEVVIARNGTPVVRIVKIERRKRRPGAWTHLMSEEVVEAAFSPAADAEIAAAFAGARIEPTAPRRALKPSNAQRRK